MEKKIFLIGTRKIHSEKNQKDYYMVDYVQYKKEEKIPKTDYISLEDFNKISAKNKKMCEVTGIFEINDFDKAYLSDIK